MKYAASSVTSFIPPGGVCKGHTIEDEPADPDYPHLSVDCPVCEPFLAGDPFWAADPEDRPLTRREEREAERVKKELEVEALISARADREFAHRQRVEAEKADKADDKKADADDKAKPEKADSEPVAPAKKAPAPKRAQKASGSSS